MAICNTVVLVGIILTSQARSMSVFMLVSALILFTTSRPA
jgi:hypothetical protein